MRGVAGMRMLLLLVIGRFSYAEPPEECEASCADSYESCFRWAAEGAWEKALVA